VLSYIITLRSGHRYTIRAEEVRLPAHGGPIEFLALPATEGAQVKQAVALFDFGDVLSIVAREHLVACEEPGESGTRPHAIAKADPIPF
jgi:hypothetical protein